jgi:hypothetical protein
MFNLNCIVLEPRYRDESNRAHPPNRWTWNTFCVLQCKLSQIHFACLLGKTRLIQCLYFILFIVCNLHGLKMLGYNRDFFSQINNRSFVIKWVFCFKIVGVCHALNWLGKPFHRWSASQRKEKKNLIVLKRPEFEFQTKIEIVLLLY